MRPTKDNIIVAVLLVVMVAAAFIFVYMPQAKRISEFEIAIATQRADLDAKSKQAMVVPDFLRRIKAMRLRYSDFHSRLPRSKELAEFLKEISKLLAREKLTTISSKTGTPQEEELFNTLPMNMKLMGSYENLGKLLTGIKKMKRFTRVQKLVITENAAPAKSKPGEGGADNRGKELKIELQLNIYFTTERNEPENEPAKQI